MATFAVAQGLAVHQNALMDLFADIARQCIANRVAYSSRMEFPVVNKGQYKALTIQQMALNAVIDVKPKLAKQLQEKQIAANAMALLGTLGQQLSPEGQAYLMELDPRYCDAIVKRFEELTGQKAQLIAHQEEEQLW